MKRILLAEYDAFLTNIYADNLRKSGYQVSIAFDGEILVNRIKIINPDLLILNADLPKMKGLDVLRKIRKDYRLDELKVVLLSSFVDNNEINEFFNLGIIKNFNKAEYTAEDITKEVKRILS